ncbi:hypothetical protein BKA62DRAFT_698225 [Auriculariales sp. MPI-PUGE-AT-0066]|nr:hypothetical protein BKA62DRAFT_698225 [Auriculariales sp. MPI-PUGE-AT-0066]
MGIHEDARKGTLLGDRLAAYLQSNPNILSELDPVSGWTPLAAAAVAGFANVVEQLLSRGAEPDALSRDGETALLLTASKTAKNRPRIIQLLLSKTPNGSVDATSSAASNNTPLMFAVQKKDIESIRLLSKAGASLTAMNDQGLTAEAMAKDKAVKRALEPEKEKSAIAKLSSIVVSSLLYVASWVNKTAKGVMRRMFGLNPAMNQTSTKYADQSNSDFLDQAFVENVDTFVKKNATLERFFKDKPNYIQELAQKATELENDPTTPLGQPDLLPKTIKVTLHQQVFYCDDSSSMKRDGRWEAQTDLVKKIAQITTRILPEGDGVALRFINQDVDNAWDLSLQSITGILDGISWQQGGDTAIGTYLKSKILQPLVYDKLEPKSLARPLLVSVITDGMPSQEKDSELVDTIKECGDKLEQAGYPRKSVKFMIGQVGTAKSAAKFLESVGNNKEIADVVFVTSDQLDAKFATFKANEADLDRWLIETLFSPIKDD